MAPTRYLDIVSHFICVLMFVCRVLNTRKGQEKAVGCHISSILRLQTNKHTRTQTQKNTTTTNNNGNNKTVKCSRDAKVSCYGAGLDRIQSKENGSEVCHVSIIHSFYNDWCQQMSVGTISSLQSRGLRGSPGYNQDAPKPTPCC